MTAATVGRTLSGPVMSRIRRFGTLATGCLLVCLVFSSIAAYAGHTDDGCAVEFHCFACVWAMTATADIVLPVEAAPVISLVGCLPAQETPGPIEAPASPFASRAPPLA